ncbi:hypothetical protein [Chelativorans salis]|uniref:Uncharacterized protein n=1 Tax=Chelativorans salis TaxID=2978478 RepID=A0ABT2LMC2_9HYPH|nr:hypothetical protein [Chelativorans sp. EGI FJ00035]MCT7375725.1 hypothetical protein [Chelativorans sp. EGI FJ00035]
MSTEKCTVEQAAALDFTPWSREGEGWQPPTREVWKEFSPRAFTILRIASEVMFKSKPELIEMLRNLDEAVGYELMNEFLSVEKDMKNALTVIGAAQARIICAGSSLEMEEE